MDTEVSMFGARRWEDANRELEGAIGAWDEHVARCPSCLRSGNTMCSEGDYLSADVAVHRDRVFEQLAYAMELDAPRVRSGVPA
jgi:hypothetical protein